MYQEDKYNVMIADITELVDGVFKFTWVTSRGTPSGLYTESSIFRRYPTKVYGDPEDDRERAIATVLMLYNNIRNVPVYGR